MARTEREIWKQAGWEAECEQKKKKRVRKQSECEELEGSSVMKSEMEKYESVYYERNRLLFILFVRRRTGGDG